MNHQKRDDDMRLTVTAARDREPAIRVQGMEKSYKELHVLRGVDFDVAPGSIFALLGSNGAGKTTMVRILSTLLRPDAGTATVHGFDVATDPNRVRESISLTGQFAAVDEILSGRENLVLVAKLRHLNDPGQVADDLLARFNLADAGSRKVSTYSGGMRRRLDIAMSLIGQPKVIFLDEPTTGLDPEGRIEVWQVVQELADQGTTVLLTTQYLEEAEQLADRIAHPSSGAHHRERHARRAEATPAAGDGRVRREAADPGGRLPRTRGETTARPRHGRTSHEHPLLRRHGHLDGPLHAPHHPQPGHDHHDRDHADRPHAAVRLRVRRRNPRPAPTTTSITCCRESC